MAREKVEFDVIGRDTSGSKAFRQVGDAAAKAGDQVEGLGKKSVKAGDQVEGLGDKTRRSGEDADGAGEAYRGLAHEIEQTQGRIRSLAEEIDRTGNKDLFKDLRRQQSELRRLNSAKSLLPDMGGAGEEAASGFVARFAARLGPLMASAPIGPAGAIAGGLLGAAAAPTIAAAVAGAVVGGAGVGGVIGGVALAARDPRVKAAGAELGGFILGDLEARASGFVPPVLEGIADIRAGWQKLGPDLDRIFASSRFIDPLVQGGISGGQKLVAGLADAIDKADPVVDSLSRGFDQIGEAAGDALSTMADDADEGAAAIDDLTMAITRLIETSAAIVHAGANVKGWSDELDVAIDKGRYWFEDLRQIGPALDLTADGFAYGTKEALAFRDATTGVADAADFATLKTAGMTDAEIAAADASGTYRQQLGEVNNALGSTGDKASVAAVEVETLSAAIARMAGENISAEQAQIRMEEAIDRATEAGRKNNDGIDRGTEKGRANRQLLVSLAEASNTTADAIMETTHSQELASDATEKGRAAFLKAAAAMGVSKSEAKRLADQLFGIPKKVDSKIMVTANTQPALDSARSIVARINNMHARINVSAEPSGGYGGSAHTGDGYSTGMSTGGRVIGPGPRGVDSEPRLLAPDEFVIRADAARAIGYDTLDQLNNADRRPMAAASPAGRSGAGSSAGGGLDYDRLARANARALSGMTLVLDDRTGRTATLIARGV